MDIVRKILECQTVAELTTLESLYVLNEYEQGLVFERKVEIISCLLEWGMGNEQLGIAASLTDSWTAEQRRQFLHDWQNDDLLLQSERVGLAANLTDFWTPEQRETFVRDWQNDEPLLQTMNEPVAQLGRGQKRSIDDVNDGASTSEGRGQKRCYEDGAGEWQDGEPSSQLGRGEKRSHDEVSDEPNDKVGDFVTLTGVKQVNVKKFRTTGLDYTFRFTDSFASQELSQYHNRLHEIFQNVVNTITRDVPEQDQTRFVLRSPQLDPPISLPFMPRERLTTERVLSEIERVVQSNHEFRLNDFVDVNLIHVEMPHGGRGTKRSEVNLERHLTKKGSVIRIQNKDELCLARALVVSKAKIDNDPRDRLIRKSERPLQTRLAQELHQKSGVPLGPCGLDEVKQFQTYLSEYQINIVSKEHQNAILYSGPEQEKRIYLYLHDNHYDVITSMPGFLARNRYCHACKKAYDHQRDHLCPNACQCCRFPDCPIVSWIHCDRCNRDFKSQECFDRHTAGDTKSICSDLVKCPDCNTVVKRNRRNPERHHCGLKKCPICKEHIKPGEHRCYMQPVKKRDTAEGLTEDEELAETEDEAEAEAGYNQLLFFDFECRQENGDHEPNLCVIQNEAGDEWVFEGDDTRNDFCEWLFTSEHEKCIVMAHNFQGYDSYFVLQYLRENGVKYDVIMRGAKVLTLSVPMFKIKFIDSLSFIPMKLADFPKTFGIEELAKGYFPHIFNRKENENYVGPIPPAPYYQPDGMNPEEKEKFLKWHNELKQNEYVFDFKQEILSYCRSDVDILRRCCLEFRELFRDVTDIDPFEKCLTIASACNLVFRTNFLEEDTIAIIPPHGYCPEHKQSILARKWLSYTAEKDEIYIQHAHNGGEKRVGRYLLDGYHEETNTAYEVHGCFWHGKFLAW